jgi:hypothetical protein
MSLKSPPPPLTANLDQCCQLFSTFSGQNGQKFWPLSSKIWALCKNSIFNTIYQNTVRLNFVAILLQKSVKIPGFQYFHMEKIKEAKRSKNSAPFLTLSGKIRPKFGRKFVQPLINLFHPFRVLQPKNRPVRNTVLRMSSLAKAL